MLGLYWSALDWTAGTLRVTHSVKRVKDRDASSGRRTRLVVSELKTPKSRRILALTPELVARFRQHRARQAEAQMAAGPLWRDHGLIFGGAAYQRCGAADLASVVCRRPLASTAVGGDLLLTDLVTRSSAGRCPRTVARTRCCTSCCTKLALKR